ncbi:MAG: hypothetical protein AABY22_27570 [Nanoarchaeota archaeon]
MGRPIKHSYNFVYNYFREQKCKLLTKKYKGTRQILNYKCSCGNFSKVDFHEFKRGTRCNKCKYERIAKKESYNIEEVRKFFKKRKCILLSKTYKNMNNIKLKYICKCGRKSEIMFSQFLYRNQNCKKCGIEKIRKSRLFTIEKVRNIFKSKNCILLSKIYKGVYKKLNFILVVAS